jgi:nucleoside-triphosphatase
MMANQAKNIFVTGLPGSGKTTFIMKLAEDLRDCRPAGFLTEETRSNRARTGFMLRSLDGRSTGMLAQADFRGPHRVGRYGVDLPGFERFLGTLRLLDPPPRIVIIDEIGRMECLSERFRGLVTALLAAPAPFIATIALRGDGFIGEVKRRPDILLRELTMGNRDALLPEIAGLIRSLIMT